MIALTLRYARTDPRDLIGQVLVAAACAFVAMLLAGLLATTMLQRAIEPESISDTAVTAAGQATGTIMGYTLIGVFAVGTGVSRLAVTSNFRRYAQWLAIGMSAGAVRRGIWSRSILAAIIGTVVASPLVVLTFPIGSDNFRQLISQDVAASLGVAVQGLGIGFGVALVITVLISVLSTGSAARTAASTPPAAMLRLRPPRLKWGGIVGRLIGAAPIAVLALAVYLALRLEETGGTPSANDADEAAAAAGLIAAYAVIVAAILVPLLASGLLRGLVALLPGRVSAGWFVLRRVVIERTALASTAIVSVAISTGLIVLRQGSEMIAASFSAGRDTGGAIDWSTFLWVFGPVLLIALAGGCASILIGAQHRELELRTLHAVGFAPRRLLFSAVGESALFVLCGVVVGVLAASIGMVAGVSIGLSHGLTWTPVFPDLTPVAVAIAVDLVALVLANLLPVAAAIRRQR